MPQGQATSNDGTSVAYRRTGAGTALVLVHGAACDHSRWAPVLPAFEERFTVCAVDRRGRGGSGDAEDFAIEREFEDVAAVVDSLEQPVILVGHSYGALCALDAALITRNVRALVLYDPSFEQVGAELYPWDVIERLESLMRAGDRDGVVVTTARQVAGVSAEVVDFMRSQPSYGARLAAAPTIPRELRAIKTYRFDPERFRDLAIPTLALTGSESPAGYRRAAEAVDDALPDSRLVVLPGQGHGAVDTGTALYIAEVLRFTDALA
ncbi:pimeloyl-ACP methyl ester carboxylesterase [Actinomycetospora succinea]|uniref:Pimeloyl-ACP methyl ester carboxylesterase n=1 Tax=Actinomycetospora succinea TaxID=663603 RepID=A0A4V3DA96_9PSEU|nr:alpha/beta hydrolase [Actinomycetospora succinea]TDQ60898.1 pimeloyl-ACP methyl ester carboxylesterase [Actinomycetospora succinea]